MDCDFSDALLDDCEFIDTRLDRSSFHLGEVTGSRFRRAEIHKCNFSQATFRHNKLVETAIANTTLGDCTFLYVVFRNCSLAQVRINAESIGGLFGLTREQVNQAGLIYLGRKEVLPEDADVVNLLVEEYRRRRWDIGTLVNELNFGLNSAFGAFDAYLGRANDRFAEIGFIKGEELRFVADIIEELAALESLPLLTAFQIANWCSYVRAVIAARTSDAGNTDAVDTLHARSTLIGHRMIDGLERSVLFRERSSSTESIVLRATFEEKPIVAVYQLMNEAAAVARLAVPPTSLVRVETGSYVEVLLATLFSATALQVFLFLVNGCLIQLTEMKQRLKVLANEDAPKAYRDLALAPKQHASPMMLSLIEGIAGYAKGLGWLKTPSMGGFATANVRSLEVLGPGEADDQLNRDPKPRRRQGRQPRR